MKANPKKTGCADKLIDGGLRITVGCFTVALVFVTGAAIMSTTNFFPLPKVGPRVPIPNVPETTIEGGMKIYQREECSSCHILNDAIPASDETRDDRYGYAPDLTHEGRRNASIDWQITNLKYHHRIYPNSEMGDCNDLTPAELNALASFLATRR